MDSEPLKKSNCNARPERVNWRYQLATNRHEGFVENPRELNSEAFRKVDQRTFRLLKLLRHLELGVKGDSRRGTAFQHQAIYLINILSTLTSMPNKMGIAA
jgi:hypothetical protein